MWCNLIGSDIKQRHPLADETLSAGQAHTALIGKEFSHSADAATAEVIDVVSHAIASAKTNEVFHGCHEIILGERALVFVHFEIKLLVDLVATYSTKVVALGIKKEALEHATRILNGWWIARAEFAVNIFEGLVLVMCRIFFERLDDRIVILRIYNFYGLMPQSNQLTHDGGS